MDRTRNIYVYKSNDTWWWQCRVPFCQLTDCHPGHKNALQAGLKHVNRHGKLGFRKGK